MTQQKKQQKNLKENLKENLKPDIVTKREIAKVGMSLSLATLVITSFMLDRNSSKSVKTAHILSGAALVGFSFYHNFLYNKKDKERLVQKD